MHRFFVPSDQISNDTATIVGSDVNHIKNVLRMTVGEKVEVFDGKGNIFNATLTLLQSDKVIFSLTKASNENCESKINITLAQCLPKAKKMDFIVQKATELGAISIIPVISERSIPKIEDKADKKISHWQKIAKEAVEQSGRTIIPTVKPLTKFEELIKNAKDYDLALIPWEGEKSTSMKDISKNKEINSILVAIGPEGGFSSNEIDLAIQNGFKTISLGKRILRTETAGIVALAQVYYELDN